MNERSLERIVAELADREAIRELTATYCHLVWQGDGRGMAALYVEDGEFRNGDGPPVRGRAAIEAMLTNSTARLSRPFIHNHIIRLDGDGATGTCEVDLRAFRDGKYAFTSGSYDDVYVRVDGTWRFRSRRFRPDPPVAVEAIPTAPR